MVFLRGIFNLIGMLIIDEIRDSTKSSWVIQTNKTYGLRHVFQNMCKYSLSCCFSAVFV